MIAELKLRSPAAGGLADAGFDRGAQLDAYARGGAAAVSVLTEPTEFKGELAHLVDAAALLAPQRRPVMRKDFVTDPYQVLEARAAGAGGILVIVTMLDDATVRALVDSARECGLFVLLEAFDRADLERLAPFDAPAGGRPAAARGRELPGPARSRRALRALRGARAVSTEALADGRRERHRHRGRRRDRREARLSARARRLVADARRGSRRDPRGARRGRPRGARAGRRDGGSADVFVKICGINSPEAAEAAVAAGADALGFVFAASPREVTPERARELCAAVPRRRHARRGAAPSRPRSCWRRVLEVFAPDWLQTDADDFAADGLETRSREAVRRSCPCTVAARRCRHSRRRGCCSRAR